MFNSTVLPAGLSLNTATGEISGTPTAAGTTNFEVKVTSAGQTATKALEITVVHPAPSVTTSSPMANGTMDVAYSQTLTATGGDGNYTWAMFNSTVLPAGLSLNTATGEISGTPTAAATTNFEVEVTSAGQTATKGLSIMVNLPPPTVSSVSPTSGPTGGGTVVTITGTDFVDGATISVGGAAATSVIFNSATSITATTPAGTVGTADVVVTNPDTQADTLVGGFTYVPPPKVSSVSPTSGPTAGGTSVTISGTDFVSGATVTFGGAPAAVGTVASTSITVTTPSGTAGTADVVVTNPDDQSSTLANGFTYVAMSLTSLNVTTGVQGGGTAVVLTGTGFSGVADATGVTFGGAAGTSFSVTNATTIAVTTPAGVGQVDVVLQHPGGNQTLTNAFTYVLPVTLTTSYLVGAYPTTGYADAIVSATGGDGNYTYSVTDGSLPDGLMLNSSTGAITGTTTGSGMSFFEITGTSVGLSASAVYSITVSTNSASGFNMWAVSVAASIPATNVRQQIDAALARWELVVTSSLGSLVLGSGASAACGLATPLIDGKLVPEVLMLIDVAPIDGPGSLIGGARTCWFATSAPFTIAGVLTLDSSDVPTMADADLFTLVWHELGHAMGIGKTHWDAFGYLSGAGTADPRYTGAVALDEYSTLLGVPAVSIPVANTGGTGTRDTHWRENVFSTEIMTGFLNQGVTNAISRMTIGSLFDVGWSVDLTAADAYSLPACAGACVRAAPPRHAADEWEVVLDLPGGIQPRGAPRSGPPRIIR